MSIAVNVHQQYPTCHPICDAKSLRGIGQSFKFRQPQTAKLFFLQMFNERWRMHQGDCWPVWCVYLLQSSCMCRQSKTCYIHIKAPASHIRIHGPLFHPTFVITISSCCKIKTDHEHLWVSLKIRKRNLPYLHKSSFRRKPIDFEVHSFRDVPDLLCFSNEQFPHCSTLRLDHEVLLFIPKLLSNKLWSF